MCARIASTLVAAWPVVAMPATATAPALPDPTVTPLPMPGAAEARVIVKFKAHGALAAETNRVFMPGVERARLLSQRLGAVVLTGRVLTPRMQVIRARRMSAAELVHQLSQDPDVEYALVDELRVPASTAPTPNDTIFSSQWYLKAPPASGTTATDGASAINAQVAWNTSTGTVEGSSAKVRVAVVDTGVRTDHPDLKNKLLPGYDLVRNDTWHGYAVACRANDGDGPDADASDPGDGLLSSELNVGTSPVFGSDKCFAASSSWHGTEVAGILAAETNNSTGIAGVAWDAQVLPVRVLGRCGGYDSDIIAGMRWAAGLPSTDPLIPLNPNPVRVINLSVRSNQQGACPKSYSDVITELANHGDGVIVVAAAGNGNLGVGEAVSIPGNCPGVITVSGLTNLGLKARYANLGPEVTLSAPSGVNDGAHSVITTTDVGTLGPEAPGYTSNTKQAAFGTSFAAPMVTGAVALMLAAEPRLRFDDVVNDLKRTARPFTQGTGGFCSSIDETRKGECNCTSSTCGAGMLDAGGAVSAARHDPHPRILRTDAAAASAPIVGVAFTLDGGTSISSPETTLAKYRWDVVGGSGVTISSPDTRSTGVRVQQAGTVEIRLTVTDSTPGTPRSNAITRTFTVVADASQSLALTAPAASSAIDAALGAAEPLAATTTDTTPATAAEISALACLASAIPDPAEVTSTGSSGGGASSSTFLMLLAAAVAAAAVLRHRLPAPSPGFQPA